MKRWTESLEGEKNQDAIDRIDGTELFSNMCGLWAETGDSSCVFVTCDYSEEAKAAGRGNAKKLALTILNHIKAYLDHKLYNISIENDVPYIDEKSPPQR